MVKRKLLNVAQSVGLPGHRRTSSHKRRRAAHFALQTASLGICPKCKNPVLPHTVCKICGYYKGREVIKIAVPTKTRKEEKHEKK